MSTSGTAPAGRPALRNPYVWVLAAVLFINYVDRGLLPTAAPMMQTDLRLDAAQLGVLMSAFFWSYALMQIPVGWVVERYGAERVLSAGLILWAGATILTGFSHGYATLIALRVLLGLGESTGFPSVSKLLAGSVERKNLGTANGIVAFSYLFGPAFGTSLGGLLMARYGWRPAFLVFGALSFVWLWPWAKAAKRRSAPQARSADSPTFAMVLRQPALWGTGLGLFSMNYTFYFMLSWLPFYLVRVRGFATAEMAELAGAAYVVTAVCALGAGFLIDRGIARGGSANFAYKSVMAIAHVGALLCMVGMALGSKPLAIACIFAYQVIGGASSPGVYAISQILAGPSATGRWVGIQNSLGNFAGVVAPALTGLIVARTGHFTAAFMLAAAVSLTGLIGWLAMIPRLAPLAWGSPSETGRVQIGDDRGGEQAINPE